jgi:hypothetical protein
MLRDDIPSHFGHHDAHDPAATRAQGRGGELPLVLSYRDMNKATDQGRVTVLGTTAGYIVRYQDAWWIADDRGWVRVTVADIAAVLDAEKQRLEIQDAIVAQTAAIRAAVILDDGQAAPDEPGS